MIELKLQTFGGGGGGSGLTYNDQGYSQKISSKSHIKGNGTYVLFDSHGRPKMKSTGAKLRSAINSGSLYYDYDIEEWVNKNGVTYIIRKKRK